MLVTCTRYLDDQTEQELAKVLNTQTNGVADLRTAVAVFKAIGLLAAKPASEIATDELKEKATSAEVVAGTDTAAFTYWLGKFSWLADCLYQCI